MKKIFKKIKNFLAPVHRFMNLVFGTVILSLVYIFGVGISYIIARLTKRKLLLKKPKNKNTYWRDTEDKEKNNYYQQF